MTTVIVKTCNSQILNISMKYVTKYIIDPGECLLFDLFVFIFPFTVKLQFGYKEKGKLRGKVGGKKREK